MRGEGRDEEKGGKRKGRDGRSEGKGKKVHVNTHSPRKVPQKNGETLTPTMGEAMLMNQFGRNGVILRNMIYHSWSSR